MIRKSEEKMMILERGDRGAGRVKVGMFTMQTVVASLQDAPKITTSWHSYFCVDPSHNELVLVCVTNSIWQRDFPGGAVVKNPPANAGDTGRSLVREDPTCHGATRPVHHNYWACTLEPTCLNY